MRLTSYKNLPQGFEEFDKLVVNSNEIVTECDKVLVVFGMSLKIKHTRVANTRQIKYILQHSSGHASCVAAFSISRPFSKGRHSPGQIGTLSLCLALV